MRRVVCGAVGAMLAVTPMAASASGPPDDAERVGLQRAGGPYVPMKTTALRQADGDPYDSVVTPNGKSLLVIGKETLRKLNITKNPAKVVGASRTVFGDEIGIGRSNRTAYVGNGEKLYVVAIDRKKPRTKRTLRLPDDVTGIRAPGNGRFLYVSYGSWTGPSRSGVRVYSLKNPRKPKKLARAKTSPGPTDVAVGLRGKRTVTVNFASSMSIINTSKPGKPRTIRRDMRLPFDADAVAAAPKSKYAYAWSGEDARLAKINLQKPKIVKVARFPQTGSGYFSDIDVTASGARVVVSRLVVGDELAVVVLRTKNLKKIFGFVEAAGVRTVATSKGGKTKNRFYLGLHGDEFGEPPLPPLVVPVRPR